MDVKVDRDKIKALRLAKSWSQEVLAEEADLSLRTIQRMELDGSASLKSRLAVALALGVEPSMLDPDQAVTDDGQSQTNPEPRHADVEPESLRQRFAYPGPPTLPGKILTPVLVVLWAGIFITGGLMLFITLPLAIWNLFSQSETMGLILIAQLPLLVVFLVSSGLYLFFRRFRPRAG